VYDRARKKTKQNWKKMFSFSLKKKKGEKKPQILLEQNNELG
jgi:hypothetical protein